MATLCEEEKKAQNEHEALTQQELAEALEAEVNREENQDVTQIPRRILCPRVSNDDGDCTSWLSIEGVDNFKTNNLARFPRGRKKRLKQPKAGGEVIVQNYKCLTLVLVGCFDLILFGVIFRDRLHSLCQIFSKIPRVNIEYDSVPTELRLPILSQKLFGGPIWVFWEAEWQPTKQCPEKETSVKVILPISFPPRKKLAHLLCVEGGDVDCAAIGR